MSFEEEFPNLKDKIWNSGDSELNEAGIDLVSTDNIMEHCSDNQKIKDALASCWLSMGKYNESMKEAMNEYINLIYKELELE